MHLIVDMHIMCMTLVLTRTKIVGAKLRIIVETIGVKANLGRKTCHCFHKQGHIKKYCYAFKNKKSIVLNRKSGGCHDIAPKYFLILHFVNIVNITNKPKMHISPRRLIHSDIGSCSHECLWSYTTTKV